MKKSHEGKNVDKIWNDFKVTPENRFIAYRCWSHFVVIKNSKSNLLYYIKIFH